MPTKPLAPERPNGTDWIELSEEWWRFSGDLPLKTSQLYDRIGQFLPGWKFEQYEVWQTKHLRFGQLLSRRDNDVIGHFQLKSALSHGKPVRWLQPLDQETRECRGKSWLDDLTDEGLDALIWAYRRESGHEEVL